MVIKIEKIKQYNKRMKIWKLLKKIWKETPSKENKCTSEQAQIPLELNLVWN